VPGNIRDELTASLCTQQLFGLHAQSRFNNFEQLIGHRVVCASRADKQGRGCM
jgi:hypothetical protein